MNFAFISDHLSALAYLLAVVLVIWLIKASRMITYVRNDQIAIVERLWSPAGSLKSGVIALNGEAGYLPQVLRGGYHFFKPFAYRLWRTPIPSIANNEIGYVYARSGETLLPSQTLGANDVANNFEDAAHFLANGGQKGPQRKILRGGVHPINLAQFIILTKERIYAHGLDAKEAAEAEKQREALLEINGFEPVVIKGDTDVIGVVVINDGPIPPKDQFVQPIVGTDPADTSRYHHAFQDPEAFLRAGGQRGRQLQVLTEGSFYINRLFAAVEIHPKEVIPVGSVGVVISFVGKDVTEDGIDGNAESSGFSRTKHGALVGEGYKGVRDKALSPGKYAWNPYAGRIVQIQTTNFVLVWREGTTSAHQLDANLKEVSLITKDAFEPTLPVSCVLHIDPTKAPRVVQRFGDLGHLVNETIDPFVSSWFKDVAQTKTVIELIQERKAVQDQAKTVMAERFANYDLELVDVMMYTPTGQSIEPILDQLRERQIATEQLATFEAQKSAAEKQRELNDAQAAAEAQAALTQSRISIQVAENEGAASVSTAQKEAAKIKLLAAAKSEAASIEGAGEGDRLASIGRGEAAATAAKMKAAGGVEYGLISTVASQFAHAVEKGRLPIVPQTLIAGGDGADGFNGLLQTINAVLAMKLPNLSETDRAKATLALDEAIADHARVGAAVRLPDDAPIQAAPGGQAAEEDSAPVAA
ncbi:SPFH domain-containing protein [Trinickia sp.]|uniref:SPFH domain-containing protein n=1 Tax=Trinickia sp. TaxID=2571163 RepID=UPI003F7FFEF6